MCRRKWSWQGLVFPPHYSHILLTSSRPEIITEQELKEKEIVEDHRPDMRPRPSHRERVGA